MIKKLLFLGLLSSCASNLHAVIAVGDTADSATTFQFSVGSGIYDAARSTLWTLSSEDISGQPSDIQEYGISYTQFIPVDSATGAKLTTYPYITSEAIVTTVDGDNTIVVPTSTVTNPLLGSSFSSVTFLGNYLTVVATATPRYVYLVQSSTFYDNASGKNSPEGISIINQFDIGLSHQAKAIAGSGGGVLFFAQAQGDFGTATSEISFAAVQNSSVADEQGKSTTYASLIPQADLEVTTSTPVLTAGGSDLASIGSSVTMYPSPTTAFNMYVGLDVTAGAGAGHQAVGMFTAVANFASDATPAAVTFSPVIPDDVAKADLQTPISAPAAHRVGVSHITTTVTSTGLSYFITARYDNTGRQSVYAMPMVTMATDTTNNGKVAAFDSIAQKFQILGATYRQQGFDTVITNPNQIDIEGTDFIVKRLQVGAGPVPLPSGVRINQLSSQGDAVYITIHQPFGTNAQPGMFKSQALFDEQGRIMSWSPWQRVAGTDDQIIFAVKNRATDATMYVSGANSDTIQQTTWNRSSDLATLIDAIPGSMSMKNGGIQGLISVSDQTTDLQGFPLVIATGNSAVIIAQTGQDSGFGSIAILDPQETATLDVDSGLDIGSVVAATFAHNSGTNDNWLFMGGSQGLSVLSNDITGVGFNGQLTNFAALTTGKTCKTLGNFSFIKKLVSNNNFLYVLTPHAVYRILLNADKFTLTPTVALSPVLILASTTIDLLASFTDMLVDNNVMLLGSTAGLYSLDLTGGMPATPVAISIPGGLPSVCRLNVISNDANFNENFYESSNLYVLSANFGAQQARLNRFTITDGIITPIQDQLLEAQNGPLLIFDYMMNNIFIDGSLGFATSYRIGSIKPIAKYMQFTLQAGNSSSQTLLKNSTTNLAITSLLSSLGVTAISRDYASGCLMLAADFGLLTDS